MFRSKGIDLRESRCCLGKERAVACHDLDALDAVRDVGVLLDAVINVTLVVDDVLVGIVRHELTRASLNCRVLSVLVDLVEHLAESWNRAVDRPHPCFSSEYAKGHSGGHICHVDGTSIFALKEPEQSSTSVTIQSPRIKVP